MAGLIHSDAIWILKLRVESSESGVWGPHNAGPPGLPPKPLRISRCFLLPMTERVNQGGNLRTIYHTGFRTKPA